MDAEVAEEASKGKIFDSHKPLKGRYSHACTSIDGVIC